MQAPSRIARLLAGLSIVLLAIPLALSTPRVKGWVFSQATTWARDRYGVDINATRFDYRLHALSASLEGVTVAAVSTPDRPMARAAYLEIDLAASAFRGRFDFERIFVRDAKIRWDASTRGVRPAPSPTNPAAANSPPPYAIATLQIENLDIDVGVGAGIGDEMRLAIHQVSATLHGRAVGDRANGADGDAADHRAAADAVLEGELTAAGGVALSFGTDAIGMAFDRVAAQVTLDRGARVTGSLRADSPVGNVSAEGTVPLSPEEPLELHYEGIAVLDQARRWWRDAPEWKGRMSLRGNIKGPLRSPEASFRVSGSDLEWSALEGATLDASGRVSSSGLAVEAFAFTSQSATVGGQGTLAFGDAQQSGFTGRWTNVGADLVARLFNRPFEAESRTALAGSAELSWHGTQPRVGTVGGRLEATARGAGHDQSATLTIEAGGRDGRWQIGVRQMLDGGTTSSLQGTVTVDETRVADSPVKGGLTVQAWDLGMALAQLRRLGVPVPVAAAGVEARRVTFDGTIAGTVGVPRLAGALVADEVRAGGLGSLQLMGNIGLDGEALAMSPLQVRASAANRATLRGTLPWHGGSGQGTVEVRLEDIAHLAHMVPDAWRPSGIVDASGEWTGSARDLAVSGRLSGSSIALNGIAFDSVSARASMTQGQFAIDDLRALQPGGALSGSGSWNRTDSTLRADLTGTNLALAVLGPTSVGTLATQAVLADVSFGARVTGPGARPDGTITLDAGSASIGHRPIGPITARAEAASGVAHVVASAPAHGATLDGRLGIETPWPFDGRLAFASTDLAALGRLAGVNGSFIERVTASVDATLEASGRAADLDATNASLSVTKIDGAMSGQPLALTHAGRLELQGERLRVTEPVRVALGKTSLSITEPSDQTATPGVVLALEGSLADLTAITPDLMPEGVTVDGAVRADVLLGGQLTDMRPTGQVTLSLASLMRGDQQLARDTTVVAEVDPSAIHVRELHGTILDGPVEGYGSAPITWLQTGRSDADPASAEPATFWLKSGASVAAVVALLREQPPDTKGALNFTVEGSAASARVESIRATLRDETGEIALGGFALKSARPTELRLEDGLLHAEQFEWHGPRSTFTASGSVGIVDGVDGRLRLTGDGSLALLTLLLPARIDGRTRFDLELSGPPGQRELLGSLGIEEGTAVVQSWRLALADWSGNVVLERDRIDVKGLRGQFNGGEATIEGRFPVGAGTTAPQSLTLTVGGAFLDLPEGLRSQIDANLEWSHTSGGARLSGEATVTARPYREPATEIARIAAALIERSGGSPIELPGTLAATSLDVRLSTVGPLAVTNSVASVELLPELQLTGTLSSPALRGQVAVADDGRIQFGGRQYRLRDSRVEFSPDRGLTPTLAVSGETRVADYTVFLRLSGTADELETALSSDPPLGERDLQTLLVTGQREALGRDSSSDQNAVGAVSGDVLGFAGQFLGFDAVTVSTSDDLALVSSDVDPALRLTVSKRIGRRFELVLSDNLDDNELTWVIIYRPRPGFEFRVLSRDNTEFTGEFRQEFQFGPGVSPPRTPPRRRPASDRVAAVTVSGEPGFAPADVLTATSLRAGDEFDFSRWLEDRDRIARLYQQRGYFAARIVPTRRRLEAERDRQRVALDYRVTRGPRTVLLVTGYAVPSEVEATLRQTWSESVLIDLLEADLARVMRGHMIDVGFLRAAIGVGVDTSQPDVVTAAVKVDPGPRSTGRRLAFSGNTVLSERELLAAIEASPGLVSPWRDPAPLLEVLQAAYSARGYLAMTAVPGAVVFDGGTATLPIVVAEGPLARVASVTVNGSNRVGQSAAASATGLSVGGPYISGSERAARTALERFYRNLGYRDIVVELGSMVDAARGRVDVTVAVDEGARHVVRAVQTTGVESTREATVERAVQIEPGSVASPAVADATRRRLYDVGTFRSAEVTFAPVGPRTDETVPVDAIVTVQESKRFLLLYGIEATNQYQSLFDQRVTSGGVAADLRDRNFLGRGWTLGAGVRYEPSFRSARLLNTVPRLGTKRIRTNMYADVSSEERTRTEDVILLDDETTVSIEQRWRPRTPVELSWGYQFNRRDLRFLDAHTDQTVIDLKGYLASLAGAIVVDRRDNMFDAKRGWLVSTTAEWGLSPLGSDFDYLRTVVRASHYQPVGPLTLASNVRWGDMLAFTGRPPVSALDLFYTAGGTQTVRGYQQDSLSAYFFEVQGQRVPLGGTKLLVFNQEVRFPLLWLLSGAAFADAGNTFTDERGIVFGDLAVGAGIGLRIRTPLAPVRIDVGFPVAGRQGQSGARWHFSIGQIF